MQRSKFSSFCKCKVKKQIWTIVRFLKCHTNFNITFPAVDVFRTNFNIVHIHWLIIDVCLCVLLFCFVEVILGPSGTLSEVKACSCCGLHRDYAKNLFNTVMADVPMVSLFGCYTKQKLWELCVYKNFYRNISRGTNAMTRGMGQLRELMFRLAVHY